MLQQSTPEALVENVDKAEETPLLIEAMSASSGIEWMSKNGAINVGFSNEACILKSAHDSEQGSVTDNLEIKNSFIEPPVQKQRSKLKINNEKPHVNLRLSPSISNFGPKPLPRSSHKTRNKNEGMYNHSSDENNSIATIIKNGDSLSSDLLVNVKDKKFQQADRFDDDGHRDLAEGMTKPAPHSPVHEIHVQNLVKNAQQDKNQQIAKTFKKKNKSALSEVYEEQNMSEVNMDLSPMKSNANNQGCEENVYVEKILSISVHYCDRLSTEFAISHPVVRVHIVDANNGTYVKKLNKDRAVTSFYETQRHDMDYIMPIMTQPSSFKDQRLIQPTWEEHLIFNENFAHFIDNRENIILFFEILDFSNTSYVGKQYRRLHNQVGLQKIAWAFLKLVGCNNIMNIGKKLRLQLYKPHLQNSVSKSSKVEVYYWWSKLQKIPIKSSLYVSVEPITSLPVEPALRSMLPTQQEQGKTTLDELAKALENDPTLLSKSLNSPVKLDLNVLIQWSRKPDESCKVPNSQCLSLNASTYSCFAIKFSHNGRALAVGCGARDQHFLLIYEIPSGVLIFRQVAHSGLLYDVDWFSDDKWLLTASGDGCVKLWSASSWECSAVLVHPSFVYSAKFHPSLPTILATACYDHIVRVWMVGANKYVKLLKEFEGHHCHVNTICWSTHGTYLFSADNIGDIKMWNTGHCGEVLNKDSTTSWSLEKEISLSEIKGIPINKISLDKEEKEIMLYCRDSTARLLNIKSKRIVVTYSGSVNCQNLLRGCTSPCGSSVYLGGEDGKVYVWDMHSGNRIAVYCALPYNGPVSCIDYHPFDHMVAMCSVEENQPICVYVYDDTVPPLVEDAENQMKSNSIPPIKLTNNRSNTMYQVPASISDEKKIPVSRGGKPDISQYIKTDAELHQSPEKDNANFDTKWKSDKMNPSYENENKNTVEDCSSSWGSTFNEITKQFHVLYDFEPENKDELMLKKGNKVSVIRKETDNWWFGMLENGQKGYFPSTYVMMDMENKGHGYEEQWDILQDEPKTLTAVITKAGNFEIISGPEDSEELLHLSPRKKKITKKVKDCTVDKQNSERISPSSKRRQRRNLLKLMAGNQ